MGGVALPLDVLSEDDLPESRVQQRTNQFVTFNVGANAYGIDIMAVREIRSWTPTTALPDQARGARGVLDIRGTIVEVYDLSIVLGTGAYDGQTNQVVLVVAIGDRVVGLAVDSVSDIVDAEDGEFAAPPTTGGKVNTIVRQNDQLISVLDLSILLR